MKKEEDLIRIIVLKETDLLFALCVEGKSFVCVCVCVVVVVAVCGSF